jgi:hypothetical protein
MNKKKYSFSQFEVIKEPEGDDFITFTLKWKTPPKNRAKVCGTISITPSNLNFVENSSIDAYLRGMGIGYKFYEKVMKELGFLSSGYFEASAPARGVWRKLSRNYFYHTNFFEGFITVYNRKKKKEL